MDISFLADRPEFINTLAPWVYEYWRPLLPQDTLAARIAKFQTHLNHQTLPIAWVAHDRSQVFGTAALRADDLPSHKNLSPWLGGVFVAPQFRRRGIGSALCSMVEQQAKHLHGVTTLYLFTLDKQHWYSSLGWSLFEPCRWCGQAGDILFKKLRAD
ncbi:MAG: GNAT family N-acetyltransferase [Gammaproteobacteria bacterium]|nr:GNAT family N-acetyltransferase [Gammaproteobacteria bacterium]